MLSTTINIDSRQINDTRLSDNQSFIISSGSRVKEQEIFNIGDNERIDLIIRFRFDKSSQNSLRLLQETNVNYSY